MNHFARVFAELIRIAEYDEEAQREYRRLRGGSRMDNRLNAAERFIDDRQSEAMRVVARARLQREASGATWGRAGQPAWVTRIAGALRRVLQREAAPPVPATVQIRRPRDV